MKKEQAANQQQSGTISRLNENSGESVHSPVTSQPPGKKKVTVAANIDSLGAMVPHDAPSEDEMPNLFQLLQPHYDGHRLTRQAGYARITVEGSLYRLTVVLPTERCQFVMETDSLVGLLANFEEAFSRGKLPQRPMADWNEKKNLPRIDKLI